MPRIIRTMLSVSLLYMISLFQFQRAFCKEWITSDPDFPWQSDSEKKKYPHCVVARPSGSLGFHPPQSISNSRAKRRGRAVNWLFSARWTFSHGTAVTGNDCARRGGGGCRCQNRRISGRGSQSVCLRLMVTGGKGHNVYPDSGPLDIGKTLLPA